MLVAEPTGRELVLTLVELASGRESWKRFTIEASSNEIIVVTPDLEYYAYSFPGIHLRAPAAGRPTRSRISVSG